jgi:hypothetical protein
MSDRYTHKLNDVSQRRGKRGAYSVRVKAETITVDLNPNKVGEPVAEAIGEVIQEAIRNISERAKPSTIKRTPGHTGRLFNVTGRLADNLGLHRNAEGEWEIGAPPGRLEGRTLSLLERLREVVPEISDMNRLLGSRKVKEALEKSVQETHRVGRLK